MMPVYNLYTSIDGTLDRMLRDHPRHSHRDSSSFSELRGRRDVIIATGGDLRSLDWFDLNAPAAVIHWLREPKGNFVVLVEIDDPNAALGFKLRFNAPEVSW